MVTSVIESSTLETGTYRARISGHAPDAQRLTRRIDWRFLLPEPGERGHPDEQLSAGVRRLPEGSRLAVVGRDDVRCHRGLAKCLG